jgi:hypothetical protein
VFENKEGGRYLASRERRTKEIRPQGFSFSVLFNDYYYGSTLKMILWVTYEREMQELRNGNAILTGSPEEETCGSCVGVRKPASWTCTLKRPPYSSTH